MIPTRTPPMKRAVLNEPELVAYIDATWQADIIITRFDGHLWESMELMRRADVLLGMHGAGMTNVMFMPQVRASISQAKRRSISYF